MSYLSDLLGSAYKEGMTEEEISTALESAIVPKNNKDNAEITKLKTALSKSNAEAADYKKQLRAKQTDEEAAKAERQAEWDKIMAENNQLKETIFKSEQTAKLMGIGYDAELASSTAEAMFKSDMSTVISNQQKFLEAKLKEQATNAMKNTPRPPVGDATKGMDYQKKIAEAQANGDTALAAYYTRMSFEQTKSE